MSTELVNKQTGELTQPQQFSREQVDLIKTTIAKGVTDDELKLFLSVAQRTKLDPFKKQIYAIKRKSGGSEVMTIQTGIGGLRTIADRTRCYSPGDATTYTYKDGKVESATAYVKKFVAGTWHITAETAFFEEFNSNDGFIWKTKPRVMLAKCAEALALRRAFPDETEGLYIPEEMEAPVQSQPPILMPQPKSKPQAKPLSEDERNQLRKKFHALADEIGLTDDEKKKFLEAICKTQSTAGLSREDFEKLFTELKNTVEPPADEPEIQ